MFRLIHVHLLLTAIILTYTFVNAAIDTTADDVEFKNPLSHGYGDDIDWVKWDDAIETAMNLKKPIFLLIHKSWCGACKALKKTFQQSSAQRAFTALSTHFVMVNTEDDDEPWEEEYKPDGKYIPRLLFLDQNGELLADFKNTRAEYKTYAYYYSNPADILISMRAVLKHLGIDVPETKKGDKLKPPTTTDEDKVSKLTPPDADDQSKKKTVKEEDKTKSKKETVKEEEHETKSKKETVKEEEHETKKKVEKKKSTDDEKEDAAATEAPKKCPKMAEKEKKEEEKKKKDKVKTTTESNKDDKEETKKSKKASADKKDKSTTTATSGKTKKEDEDDSTEKAKTDDDDHKPSPPSTKKPADAKAPSVEKPSTKKKSKAEKSEL